MEYSDFIEVAVWVQILVICTLFMVQPTKATKKLAILYGFTLIFHAVLFKYTPAFDDKQLWFYILGGALDLFVIIYTCTIKELSRVVSDVQDISLVSILFNTVGMSLSYFSAEPEMYMTIFAALYSWAIYILLRGAFKNDRFAEIDTRLLAFNRDAHKWNMFSFRKQKE